MLNVPEEVKEMYLSDSTDKTLILMFYHPGDADPFFTIYNQELIMAQTMDISESLSTNEDIEPGACESTEFKITLVDVEENLIGSYLHVYHVLSGLYPEEDVFPAETGVYPSGEEVPLGQYIVTSAYREENRSRRDIEAFDYMTLFDVDVTDWYKSLTFPMTLRQFRASLCDYIGVREEVPDYLPNDGMTVEETIEPEQLMGRDVLVCCEQINGVYGHFDRNGVLQHICLRPNEGIYPATDLYPSETLYPMAAEDANNQVADETITKNLMISCKWEDYTVAPIECVQIREEEGDVGAAYGSGNVLVIQGNFLVYGKSTDEMTEIAREIYGMVAKRSYIPYEATMKGLPYVEVGDSLLLEFADDETGETTTSIVSYVVNRTLTGIFALKDEIHATGNEERATESNITTEIIQLQGKAAILKKSVESVSAELHDFEENTEARFEITAEQISAEVKRAEESEAALTIRADEIELSVTNLAEETSASIKILSDEITLKVDLGDVSNQLSIETSGITITGNRFTWTADNSTMTRDGTLTCNNIVCTNGDFSGKITATSGEIGGFTISDSALTASSRYARISFGYDYYFDSEGAYIFDSIFDEDDECFYIGSIGYYYSHRWEFNTGDIYVNDVYIDGSWWDRDSLTEDFRQLWNHVYYGGWSGGGCDYCDDYDEWCDSCSGDGYSCTCDHYTCSDYCSGYSCYTCGPGDG